MVTGGHVWRRGVAPTRFDQLGIVGVHRVDDEWSNAIPTRIRNQMVRVDVTADGHCGAYVLAILTCAVARRMCSVTQIRDTIHSEAMQLSQGAPITIAERRRFARLFRCVASHTFLHECELVLFLHALGLNVCIVIAAGPAGPARVFRYADAAGVGWALLKFSLGCHWELYARGHEDGIFPVWNDASMTAILGALARTGAFVSDEATPATSYFTRLGTVPMFAIDFQDRIWITRTASRHSSRTRRTRPTT